MHNVIFTSNSKLCKSITENYGCSEKQVLTFSLGVGSGGELQEPAWRNLQQEHTV